MIKLFGKSKLVRDISANTLQIGITQVFSLIIFYITSKYLVKEEFGELNWCTAIGSTVITMASLGLDVVFVRKIAAGENALLMSGIHFFHTVLVGTILGAAVFFVEIFFPGFKDLHPLFLLVFINLSILNIANSFKLCIMGLEKYRYLAIIAVIGNVFKFSLIVALYWFNYFTILNVVYVFLITAVIEFLLGYFFLNRSLRAKVLPVLQIQNYKYFILESLPQYGVVFFDAALARIDWILLGILSTAAATAEYSFVYRMYESAKLPLLVIAPILLTRFSRMYSNASDFEEKKKEDIRLFFQFELFLVMLIPIVLICVWSPLIDYFTDGKYGAVNEKNFLILAACVPMHCIANFLWSMGFAQGQLKTIMYITIITAVTNLLLNYFFIPKWGSEGASWSFLIATSIQVTLYILWMDQRRLKLESKTCILAFVNGVLAVVAAKYLTNNPIFATAIALAVSTVFALVTKQIRIVQLQRVLKA